MLLEGGIQSIGGGTPKFGSGLFEKIIEGIKDTTSNEDEENKTLKTFQNIWNFPINNKKQQPQVSSESYNFNPSPIQTQYILSQSNGIVSAPLANFGKSQRNSLYDYLVR